MDETPNSLNLICENMKNMKEAYNSTENVD